MRSRALLASLALLASPAFADGPLPHRTDLTPVDRARVAQVTTPPTSFAAAQAFEAMSGGAGTNMAPPSEDAFAQPSANLSFEQELDFELGNALFMKLWVSSPASTKASDGLGPLYNARSCQRCHIADGRGHPPEGPEDDAVSMFLRLSVPPKTQADKDKLASKDLLRIPHPVYGGQLQDHALPGLPIEGSMTVSYTEKTVTLSGGETVSLRAPTYGIADAGYGPLGADLMISPRVAPPMIGLGLLEAIHPGDLLTQADPEDADGDGISGRASMVKLGGALQIGRFGWKAGHASVRAQSADAFAGDIGISTPEFPLHWGDCTDTQTACLALPNGVQAHLGDTEAPPPVMDLVAFYAANLAVPKRRDVTDPAVLRGKAQFHSSGCAACHTPSYVTSRDALRSEHRFQLIHPYTDLLLHDMGPGLADGRPVGDASGQEWKTPPLWGIGLTKMVNGHTFFLHDGRARSLLEAILWHGGEAEAAKQSVIKLSPDERADLIRFLESL